MVAVLQTTNIQNASSSTTNLALDTSGNVSVGSSLTAANNITATSGTVVMASSFLRNRLINGGMQIWQRGTSGFTTLGNYCADRWQISASGSLSTVAQSTDVPSGFQYSLSISATNTPYFNQKIESVNCYDLAGQSVTISFWLKQTTGAGAGAVSLNLQYANSVDNWSAATGIGSSTSFTTTSSWAYYTATYTNLPTNVKNGLMVQIVGNTSGSTAFLVTGVQLEQGSVATPFERRLYGQELALCQRYYEQSYDYGTVAGTATYSSATLASTGNPNILMLGTYKVTKRTAPTVAVYSPYNGASGNMSSGSTNYSANLSSWGSAPGTNSFGSYNSTNAGTNNYYMQWTASAEL
jgi:hypothetical protein